MKGYTPHSSYRSYSSTDSDKDPTLLSNIIRINHSQDVFQKYEVKQVLGTGSMCSVSIVRKKHDKVGGSAFENHSTKTRGFLGIPGLFATHHRHSTSSITDRPNESEEYLYALKTIHLDKLSSFSISELQNEVAILRTLDHPNIIKVHEVFDRPKRLNKQIYVVLELCTGGNLFTRLPYSQKEAARIVEEICSAVSYLHEHNIVHRDLKFENIMFENTSADAQIKIIDFGLSKKFLPNQEPKMKELVGTMYTLAPEVFRREYSREADMWSIGVMAFMLLTNSAAFHDDDRSKMKTLIMRGKAVYDNRIWSKIDVAAKEFVQSLLVVDPNKRMDAATALHHPWIQNRELLSNEKPSDELLRLVDNSIINYHHSTALKKIALNIVAHKSTKQEIFNLRKVFNKFDQEKDGILTFDEFKTGIQKTIRKNISDELIEDIFTSIDVNRNGHIMYTEFIAAALEAHGQIAEDLIAEAFDRIDSDDKGYITRQDISTALGGHCTREEVDEIIECADYDHDGKISYQEFLRNFREKRHELVRSVSIAPRLDDQTNAESDDNDIISSNQ